jgi:hypothetical protein
MSVELFFCVARFEGISEQIWKALDAKMTENVATGHPNHGIMPAFIKSGVVPWLGRSEPHFCAVCFPRDLKIFKIL